MTARRVDDLCRVRLVDEDNGVMAAPVIITRPEAQAQSLAARVAATGREAILFPLLEIHPLADPLPLRTALSRLDDYCLVAFVSPNAIDAAFAQLEAWPQHVPIAVMGPGSRSALARHGVTEDSTTILSPRDPVRTDSETLLAALDLDALAGKRVLVIRGDGGRELLADALREAGAKVDQVAAYCRAAPVLDERRRKLLCDLLSRRNLWVVTSSEGLRNLLEMVRQIDAVDPVAKLQPQAFLVPHARIADTARSLGLHQVTLTGSGDELLLAALQFAP